MKFYPSSSPRSPGVDAARVLGLVAIVAGHAFLDDVVLGRATFSWHVPIFFFLTGLLWRNGRSVRDELTKRSWSLLLPYAAWFILLFVAYESIALFFGRANPRTAAQLVWGGYFTWAPFTTFWFLTVLFGTAVYYRVLERLGRWGKVGGTALGLVLSILAGGFLGRTPLGLGSALTCVVFVAAGELAGRVVMPHRSARLVLAAVGAGWFALVVSGALLPLNLKAGFFGTPVASAVGACAISIAVLVGCDALVRRSDGRVARVLVRLAVPAVAVVLLHPVVLWGSTITGLAARAPAAAFIAALVLPWAAGLVLHLTRLSPVLLGTPRRIGSSPRTATATAARAHV